jgi:Mn2+/Fe2+ NRAMP family transporter
MDAETADDLRELVAYDEDTAGGLMTTDYVWIYPHRTVAATIAKIREIAPETEFIYYLYVTDPSEKLLGVLSLRTLLLSAPDAIIHTVMDSDIVSVHPDARSTDVASTIARYDLLACPVVDDDGKMLGIVTVDDAIDAIIPEKITNAGLCKTVLVIASAVLVFQVVTRANRAVVERIFFVLCSIYLSYVVSAIVVHPDWHDVIHQTFFPHFGSSKAYLLMIIAIIGTTISPWMQFYIQAAIVEKGVRESQYAASRIDVISGAFVTDIIAFFIVVACAATIYMHNLHSPSGQQIGVNDVGDVAVALKPLAGRFASLLFAIGLLNAALFTASILPLSTAYYVCEAFGFERGVDRRFGDAKIFYGLYLAFILIGAGVVIVPNAPLLGIIFYSQVLNGALLPVVLVLMLLLVNNKSLMGKWTNGVAFNAIAWTTVVIVSVLTVISTLQVVFPQIGS